MNATTPTPDSLLDAGGLARRLNVGIATVVEMRRAGRIPFVRIGPKTIRFDYHDVMAALRQQQRKPDSPAS